MELTPLADVTPANWLQLAPARRAGARPELKPELLLLDNPLTGSARGIGNGCCIFWTTCGAATNCVRRKADDDGGHDR